MKIKKILSAVAAASLAATALVTSASAVGIKVSGNANNHFSDVGGNIGIFVYSLGQEKLGEPGYDVPKGDLAGDCGFEMEDVAKASFTIRVPEVDSMGMEDNRDVWDGQIGGGLVLSLRSDTDRKHNWVSMGQFWGVVDEELEINTIDDKVEYPYELKKIGDYTYQLDAEFDSSELFDTLEGDHVVDYRVFMQIWGDACLAEVEFVEGSLLDADGNVLVTIDNTGSVVGADADAGNDDAAGDTDGATGEDKNSADTGVEGVAAVAGVAVLAAGAAILSKKRK